MTDFMYDNEEKLNLLSSRILENAQCEKANDQEWLNVYKYILAYMVITKGGLCYVLLEKIRRQILVHNTKKETLVFLEKIEYKPTDFLFFETYMRKAERDANFLSTWRTYFAKVV